MSRPGTAPHLSADRSDRQGFFIRYLERQVYFGQGHVSGDASLADALGDRCPLGSKLAARIIVEQSGPGRICKSYSDIGVSLVERNADAGQRATGTCSGSQ